MISEQGSWLANRLFLQRADSWKCDHQQGHHPAAALLQDLLRPGHGPALTQAGRQHRRHGLQG